MEHVLTPNIRFLSCLGLRKNRTSVRPTRSPPPLPPSRPLVGMVFLDVISFGAPLYFLSVDSYDSFNSETLKSEDLKAYTPSSKVKLMPTTSNPHETLSLKTRCVRAYYTAEVVGGGGWGKKGWAYGGGGGRAGESSPPFFPATTTTTPTTDVTIVGGTRTNKVKQGSRSPSWTRRYGEWWLSERTTFAPKSINS